MLDVRRFRHDPDELKAALARRGDGEFPAMVDEVRALDEKRRAALGEVNELKAERNESSKRIGELKRSGENADELIVAMRTVGDRIAVLDAEAGACEERIDEIVLSVPNTPMERVPEGGEDNNEVISTWGDPAVFDPVILLHPGGTDQYRLQQLTHRLGFEAL